MTQTMQARQLGSGRVIDSYVGTHNCIIVTTVVILKIHFL